MNFGIRNNGEGPPGDGEPGGIDFQAYNLKLITMVVLGVVALILLIVLSTVSFTLYTDWLWYDSLGYLSVLRKVLGMRIWLFFGGALTAAGFLAVNLLVAYRISRGESVLPAPPEVIRMARIAVVVGAVLTGVIMSVVFGVVAQGRWETFLLYFNRVPFGVEDPVFHKDMSFHVAVMPMLHFIQGWFMGLVIAIAVAVSALYLAVSAVRGISFTLTPRMRIHLAVLGAFLMLTIAAAHYLDIFELLYSGRGAAPGAGYADVNARLPALWLLVGIATVAAVGFAVSIRYVGLRLMIASFSLWAVLAILAGAIYPVGFERFRVKPNEFTREEKYIDRAIQATRAAYNLDNVQERLFPYNPVLDAQTVEDNIGTIQNIRLWDHRPLRDTYNQIQAFQLYYNFVGVDVDRYRFPDGEYRQVMLSARELFPENLEEDAQNWVNRKLAFTHGYGAAMSPVNRHTGDGLPEFFLRDVPPVSLKDPLNVVRPEVYYGENTKDFVIVNTKTDEFDFRGEEAAPTYKDYEGTGGVNIGSFMRRLAYAWKFLDFNVLISGQIGSESSVQYRREVQDRVHTVAPFLRLDADPYLVVGDGGRLWWIQDAYTVTDRYAYSQLFNDEFNYIRNSVKVVVDAYNGTVNFFVIDTDDPIIKMYRKAFPDLFQDFDQMGALDPALPDHIRYPLDLFATQADTLLRYHMQDPLEFFSKGDLWTVAREVFENPTNTQDVEPYYMIMKLPGENTEEFVLLLPFTPASEARKNMVGWMAARNDGENYGKLITFTFAGQVFGPEQIESRITSDEEIGKEMTLLCPEGKLCIRGNLLVIPMGESLLYVEPLYIRAQALPLPLLTKVIVADAERVVMSDTLNDSLNLLLGTTAVDLVGETPTGQDGDKPPPAGDVSGSVLADVLFEIGVIEGAVDDLKGSLEALEEALRKINETRGGAAQ